MVVLVLLFDRVRYTKWFEYSQIKSSTGFKILRYIHQKKKEIKKIEITIMYR